MSTIFKMTLFYIGLISSLFANPDFNTSGSANIQTNSATTTQQALTTQISEFVKQYMQAKQIPGYYLAVIQDGKVILNQSFGFTNIQSRTPVTNQSIFGLASITKTFTAMALLKLVESGKINLDAPLSTYIPNLTPQYRNITIRQLASMTAGIPQGVPKAANVKWPNPQMQILLQHPLISPPGQNYLYSNFSYRLIGQVIENVTSKSYLTFISQLILTPLQMKNTGTVQSLKSTGLVVTPYADNLGKGPLKAIHFRDPQVEFSAGMLATNGDDLIRYVKALLNQQILKPSSYQTLWMVRPNLPNGKASNWAFGWGSRVQADGKRIIGMNGADPGVASSIIMIPETNCAVIGLSNVRDPAVYAIARRVARMACRVLPKARNAGKEEIPAGLN